jgi:cellobiose phosphorylase
VTTVTPATLLPGAADRVLHNAAGLRIALTPHGALRRISFGALMVNQYPADAIDGGPAGLWLRRLEGDAPQALPLLGPRSPMAWHEDEDTHTASASGRWGDLDLQLQLRLAADRAAWFWHVLVTNRGDAPVRLDCLSAQDVGLSTPGAIRLNEYYTSHYVDLTPLAHAHCGHVLAARQNLAVEGLHPWALFGSLRRAVAYATDGLQFHGLALRRGADPQALADGLPARRLQHEHALVALQDGAVDLAPGASVAFGRFACVEADHPGATSAPDVARVDALRTCPEASAQAVGSGASPVRAPNALFARAQPLNGDDADTHELDTWFSPQRRHAETADDGGLLSFFHGAEAHVALRAKELGAMRPHGHLLRTGDTLVPDEAALTSTVWMAGVFHSMLTQGHVNTNRLLSTVRSWLGYFPSHGQRLFVREPGSAWRLLGVPSAFEMQPGACRWLYRHEGGLIEVRSSAGPGHVMALDLLVHAGAPVEVLATQRIALAGDDGCDPHPLCWHLDDHGAVQLEMPPGSAMEDRFPQGRFVIAPAPGTAFAAVGGDERLFDDGRSRGEPFVCIEAAATRRFGLRVTGALVDQAPLPTQAIALPRLRGAACAEAAQLADVLPWFTHDALIHYLAPRGLEQFSGGGWGTRDVCQGPVELLLALDHPAPLRDLLQRVFAAQNADGDWPQWFMFFERDRAVRAGDSHGDIVFWPLLALGRYLVASRDAGVLDVPLPFHDDAPAPLWQHVQRALAVIVRRRIPGTMLAAYGHGDWNDALQPADPSLREHLSSAWTVTLHHQVLTTLARGLRDVGRDADALPLEHDAAQVQADFRRWLLRDGVVAGYGLFDGQADAAGTAPPQLLLHPQDTRTGVRYSLLPLMHAVLEDMLTPDEARAQLALIRTHLWSPDGARLFDRPMPYRGGPQTLFQRAESSAFFGREIGLMYSHAHLRYAQALAHAGDARALGEAIALAHPIGLPERLPQATRRQANCYFTSSDAAFADRYEAERRYAEIAAGSVPLDGGWRVYSSGPGLFVALIVRDRLGLRREGPHLVIDPVLEAAQDGLRAGIHLAGLDLDLHYRVGRVGSGPTALLLDGHALPFDRAPHHLRVGGAIVPLAALTAATAGRRAELTVVLP